MMIVFLIITVVNADSLLFLNKLWMKLGQLLGIIISPIILAIIFFALFTPYSLIMRLFGRDELRLKLGERESHWKSREQLMPQTNFTKQNLYDNIVIQIFFFSNYFKKKKFV